jgi:hypothetical protein
LAPEGIVPRMHTIHELDELGGALNTSVTSIGGAKCESLMPTRIPANRLASSGCGETSGAAGSDTEEQAHRPRHSKDSKLLIRTYDIAISSRV